MTPFSAGIVTIPHETPFDPSDLSGLQIWLDARYGVTAPGGITSAVVDQSGNGHDADVPGGFTGPLLIADGINGLASFGATQSQALKIAGVETGFLTSVHAYLISQGVGATEPPGLSQGAWNFGSGSAGFCDYLNGTIYDNFGSSGRPGSTGAHPDLTLPFCLEVSYPPPSPTTTVRTVKVNGETVITEGACTPGWASSALSQVLLMSSTAANYTGYQSALIVFDHEQSAPDRAKMAAWILKTWGISI